MAATIVPQEVRVLHCTFHLAFVKFRSISRIICEQEKAVAMNRRPGIEHNNLAVDAASRLGAYRRDGALQLRSSGQV